MTSVDTCAVTGYQCSPDTRTGEMSLSVGCFIVTSLVSAVLSESSINIDISISEEGENSNVIGRNTTSTVIKTQDTLATIGADCDTRNVSVGSELWFGVARDNVIGLSGNLSWSADNIVNIDCVTGRS